MRAARHTIYALQPGAGLWVEHTLKCDAVAFALRHSVC